ncbi:MAG: 30S ribosomal protein S9 [Chloroflexi bacterium]|nr:30S ribosomal protein S9 [Chloroflexota bacterium]
MSEQVKVRGTGRRRTAVAQVKLTPGKGTIVINGRPMEEYFGLESQRRAVLRPLEVTNTLGKFDVAVKATGGGLNGQAGAASQGMARALVQVDEALKKVLRGYGLLTRDPRAKERKKYGLKRARKAPQYTKR